eukprot:CAMPEP_0170161960 /NCGR_PEP_ID=MMETSP0033_2-20121228/76842_1 /TAXON_ID=195969 /ORGANISM="Dolichomastix tenuilepis, Strain CCMP3274" /LENGTH=198 /DNA_ID=CAMNT_0010399585 /DNA_START=58 /DNA_END=654 /DNA_ORIENTATION=-
MADEPEIDTSKKHPLEHTWSLWYDNPAGKQKQSTWGSTLRMVYTFNTVEDFWCLYNNIVAPSKLIHGTDFHLFKEGIEPKWEDPRNAKGGKWTYNIPKGANRGSTDQCWLNVLLSLIGEQYAEPSEVCGAVISVRQKGDRCSIWTRTSSNETVQMALGRQFKQFCGVTQNGGEMARIGYMVHDDAIKLDRKAKDRYTV